MTKTNSNPWLKSSASIKGIIPTPRKKGLSPSPRHSLFSLLSVVQKKFQQINYAKNISNINLFNINLTHKNKVTLTLIDFVKSDFILNNVFKIIQKYTPFCFLKFNEN